MNASSAPAAGSGISGGDMTDAPTALNAATVLTGAGMDFLEAMDTAGWNFATAEPLRDALNAYLADAQAELTVMISGAAGARHRNAGAYQEGRGARTPKAALAPRPAPRPHPYIAPQEPPVTDDQLPADQPAPVTEVAPAAEVAPADLSDEALHTERDQLEALILGDENDPPRDYTPEQRRRWRSLVFEQMDRLGAETAAEIERMDQETERRKQAAEKARLKEDQMWARIDAAKDALDAADSTAAGAAALQGLTRPDLFKLADTLGIPVENRETKAQLQQHIVAGTVGTRSTPQAPLPAAASTREQAVRGAYDAISAQFREQASADDLHFNHGVFSVGLDDLRQHPLMQGLSRDDQDQALRLIARLPDVSLVAEDNLPALSTEERAAAVGIGGKDRHYLRITPAMSPEPLLENGWGGIGGELAYHPDTAIGTAIAQMRQDVHLQVEGGALANVLGRIATSVTAGRRTSREATEAVKTVRDQVPSGSAARRALDRALETMNPGETPTVLVPDGTPEPLRQLMLDLGAVPATSDGISETHKLGEVLTDYAGGRVSWSSLQSLVRRLTGGRHESEEGFAEVEAAVTRALAALKALGRPA